METKNQIAQDLAELRWLLTKLEEMKNVNGMQAHTPGQERDIQTQNVSSQFFLGLMGSASGDLCTMK
jgi:hypothetical protein